MGGTFCPGRGPMRESRILQEAVGGGLDREKLELHLGLEKTSHASFKIFKRNFPTRQECLIRLGRLSQTKKSENSFLLIGTTAQLARLMARLPESY